MINKVTIQDSFWKNYRNLVRSEMIPYQWSVLNDQVDITIVPERKDDRIPSEKSHAIENLKIAAGLKEGHHYGWVFQDSDVYKWLEAVAYSLEETADKDLQELADGVVDLIAAAQEEDGYLDTYFTIDAPERKFKRLVESHELYCAGHFMEAAVAYHHATGSEKVLHTACKLADFLDRTFGPEEGKIHGYDGHEEVEIGLTKLYRATGEKRYLELSRYFLYERGTKDFLMKQKAEDPDTSCILPGAENSPAFSFQDHLPIFEQTTAEGHAVRLVYLCTAMADVACEAGDAKLLAACRTLWRNIVDKRMYITGGIGSTYQGEAFTLDYDLPNDTMYCETCASIGLIFFANQMLRNEAKGEYGDIMELALFNTVLGGMALDGKHFFYVNPLEAVPAKSELDPGKGHVICERPQWLGCACCPPNLARLLTSLDQYVYVKKEDSLLVNLFMTCEGEFAFGEQTLKISQTANYPWEGKVTFRLESTGDVPVNVGIRVPGWAENGKFTVNGEEIQAEVKDGFAYFNRSFKGDTIVMELPMEVQRYYAHPCIRNDVDKVTLMRGPVVYCLEGVDNGENLQMLSLGADAEITEVFEKELLGGVVTLTAQGERIKMCAPAQRPLYSRRNPARETEEVTLKFIPYYSWANRGENEMAVWVRERIGTIPRSVL